MVAQVKSLVVGAFQVNCYIVFDEISKEAAVIDPGGDAALIEEALSGLAVKYILLTHAHFDHTGAVEPIRRATGAPVCIHAAEEAWLVDPTKPFNASMLAGIDIAPNSPPDRRLAHGERLPLGNCEIEVRHAPGHSPGGLVYVVGDKVFSGDVLFEGSIGRTDLTGGSLELLLESIKRQLLTLPPATQVLPGHGPSTTIEEELNYNPFLGQLS